MSVDVLDEQGCRGEPGDPYAAGKKLLAPSVKYEIFLQLMRGETTINQAAEAAGVDRSTIMKLRQVAKEGAMAALSASKPGVLQGEFDLYDTTHFTRCGAKVLIIEDLVSRK